MNESSMYISTSIISKETEVSSSFESQHPIKEDIVSHIISSIITNLKELIEYNESAGNNKYSHRDPFCITNIPSISLKDYIIRIYKLTKMDISSLIIAIIYIDRFCDRFKYSLNMYNIFKVFLTTCSLSIKYNEDIFVNTKTYAEISGIPVNVLIELEEKMFIYLGYNCYINDDLYQQYFEFFSKKNNKK